MKTFRPFFYLLLAANIVLAILSTLPLVGIQLPWAPSGESDRLTRQLTPEKIQVLRPDSIHPKPETATATAEASTGQNPNTVSCIALRGLSSEASQQLSEQVGHQSDALSIRVSGITPTSYWVNIPPNGGKDGANKRGEILVKAGFEDYIIVRDSGPTQYAISLGLFRNEDAANRLMEQLRKKNIKSARITVRDNTGNNARVEVTGRNELLEPFIKDFLATHKDPQREACQQTN